MRLAAVEKALGVSFAERHVDDGRRVFSADVRDVGDAISRARASCIETERDVGALVVGLFDADDAHHVYLFPKTGSLELVEIFRVGTHNAKDDDWKAVKATLARIHGKSPFSAYFADRAGYKARFVRAPSIETAKRFADAILEVDIEALAISDGPERMIERMHEEGIFELWWD